MKNSYSEKETKKLGRWERKCMPWRSLDLQFEKRKSFLLWKGGKCHAMEIAII